MTGDNETEPKLHIWIDADACPRTIKEIVFKTSKRLQLRVTLVANQGMYSPSSELIEVITVPHGADVADDKIVSLVQNNDLVITGDIPLAARVVEKGAKEGLHKLTWDKGKVTSAAATF